MRRAGPRRKRISTNNQDCGRYSRSPQASGATSVHIHKRDQRDAFEDTANGLKMWLMGRSPILVVVLAEVDLSAWRV